MTSYSLANSEKRELRRLYYYKEKLVDELSLAYAEALRREETDQTDNGHLNG